MCQEMYGLYLLEHIDRQKMLGMSNPAVMSSVKMSEKPQISAASAEIWHRRLGHLYPRRVETLAEMVDGMEIKGGILTDEPQICETCQITELKR